MTEDGYDIVGKGHSYHVGQDFVKERKAYIITSLFKPVPT